MGGFGLSDPEWRDGWVGTAPGVVLRAREGLPGGFLPLAAELRRYVAFLR